MLLVFADLFLSEAFGGLIEENMHKNKKHSNFAMHRILKSSYTEFKDICLMPAMR